MGKDSDMEALSQKMEELEKQVTVIERVMFGPPGEPQNSLVTSVDKISKSLGLLGKFFWFVLISFAGLIITAIWHLIVNAG